MALVWLWLGRVPIDDPITETKRNRGSHGPSFMPIPEAQVWCWPTWTKSGRKVVPQGQCRFCSEKMYSGQTEIIHVPSSFQVWDRHISGHVPNGYHVYIFCLPHRHSSIFQSMNSSISLPQGLHLPHCHTFSIYCYDHHHFHCLLEVLVWGGKSNS